MSNRTKAANTVSILAWEKEQQRVLKGEGTRDWTPKQQQDIIDRGKAYDEDGKAFECQHMKSVEEHPEFQGEPDNIQFLTRQEHFEAHKRNWQNPTNWYYDPVTKEYHDFGDGKYVPCKVIKLSLPICIQSLDSLDESKASLEENRGGSIRNSAKKGSNTNDDKSERKPIVTQEDAKRITAPSTESESFIIRGFHRVTDGWRNFQTSHPILSVVITEGVKLAADVAVSYSVSKAARRFNSRSSKSVSSTSSKTSEISKTADTIASTITETIEHGTHASPVQHTVSGHIRHRNGKEIHVKPYTRGGNK